MHHTTVATDNGILVNNSLIVSSAKSNRMPVDSETKSKEVMHSFGLTVMFSITSGNCAELGRLLCAPLAVHTHDLLMPLLVTFFWSEVWV